MAISFNEVPSGIRVPFVYVEFDDTRALQGPSLQTYEILCIGQRLAAGTVAELIPKVATNADQVGDFFGFGSQLHLMAKRLFQNNVTVKTTFVAQDDAGGSVAATGTIQVNTAATAAGTLYLYVGGTRIQVAVASGDSAATIATAINAAVALETDLPVTAGVLTDTVTFTAQNKGTRGNAIDLRVNYFEGEELPDGVTVTIVGMSGGTGDPTISDVWAVLGDTHYNVWAVAYDDTANLALLNTELDDRAGPLRQIEAVAFLATRDTHANLLTKGAAQNGKYVSIIGYDESPSSPWDWTGALAGVIANSARNDPARPFQTLPLVGILAPPAANRFDLAERDLLLNDGIATFKVDADGTVRCERIITTFQTNAAGAASTAYLDATTPLTLGYLRFDFRTQLLLRYPRHKLASDGTKFGSGQAILTPKLAKAEAVRIARGWENLGLVEGIDQFAEDLIVERNLQDPTRLDFLLPPDLVNGARVFGAQIGFLL